MPDLIKGLLVKSSARLSFMQKLYLAVYTTGMLPQNQIYDWHCLMRQILHPDDTVAQLYGNPAVLIQEADYIQCDMTSCKTELFIQLMQNCHPFIQLSACGNQWMDIVPFFSQFGYEAYHLERRKLTPYQVLHPDKKGNADILFIHISKHDQVEPLVALFRYGLTSNSSW